MIFYCHITTDCTCFILLLNCFCCLFFLILIYLTYIYTVFHACVEEADVYNPGFTPIAELTNLFLPFEFDAKEANMGAARMTMTVMGHQQDSIIKFCVKGQNREAWLSVKEFLFI